MKVRLIIDMEMAPSTDWLNTRLVDFQQSTNEVNSLADHLDLAGHLGEHVTSVRAQIIDGDGREVVSEVLGGTYEAPPAGAL